MHIEFIGLPGSGKTTLRRRLLRCLKRDSEGCFISSEEAFLEMAKHKIDRVFRYPLKSLPNSLALRFAKKLVNRSLMQFDAQNLFVASYGGALDAFLASDAYQRMSVIDRQRVIGGFLSMGAMWQCTHRETTKENVILFEEGLVQKSFMFVDHSYDATADRENIYKYLNSIPEASLIIYSIASQQTSLNRMLSRPDGLTDRLAQSSESVIQKFLAAADNHLDIIVDWLKENRPDGYVLLDTEKNDESDFDFVKNRVALLIS